MIEQLTQTFRAINAAMDAGIDPGVLIKWVRDYGPLIIAMIELIEGERDESKRQVAADAFARALRYAKETGDTSQLEAAIRAHCGPDGCQLP